MYCSPNVPITSNYTCFEKQELQEIAVALNLSIAKQYAMYNYCKNCAKPPKQIVNIEDKTKKELWRSIYKRLQNVCKQESCWIDLDFINLIQDKSLVDKLKHFTFKPKMTKNRTDWLSTLQINNVMQQYQEFDKNFKFLGALPSDFYTQIQLDYKQLKNYKKAAIVFNLDTHDKPGSHWVVLYIDNTNKLVEYFDSTGKSPNKHIKKFIQLLKTLNITKGYKYLQNTIVHQTKNSECGIYSMYYIIQRLLGKDFLNLTFNVIKDDDMNRFRDLIFRKY